MKPVPIDLKQKGQLWLLPPYNWSHRKIAKELDVSPSVVSGWRQELIREGRLDESVKSNSCDDFSPEERFFIVLETATLTERELAEYCRQKGIFIEDVKLWKSLSVKAQADNSGINEYRESKALREEKKKVRELEKELHRKEKALAETAALLVLREKFVGLRENSEED